MVKELKGKDRTTQVSNLVRLQRVSLISSTGAQAFVIGALLILGTLFAVTSLYLSTEAPSETKQCEFLHSTEVTEDFIALNTSVCNLLQSSSPLASTSISIKMSPTKESLISLPVSSGAIRFSPTAANITVILDINGTGTSGMWHDEDFTNSTTQKVNTSSGSVTLAGPPYSFGYIESNMNVAEGHSGKDTGTNNTVYEHMSWYTDLPMNTRVVMKVRTDMFPNMTHAKDWGECPEIESQSGFNTINLSGLSSVSNGHRYVQYRADLETWKSSQTPTLLNVTINFSSPSGGVTLSQSSGSIIFTGNYHYFPKQELAYESGAVIKSQDKGEFVLDNPIFSFSNMSGVPSIAISLVNLTGTNLTSSGALASSLNLYRRDYELISDSFYYPNVTLKLSTNYGTAWGKWFEEALKNSNLIAVYDYSQPTVSDGTVTVEFYGNGRGIQLYLEKITILVNIKQ